MSISKLFGVFAARVMLSSVPAFAAGEGKCIPVRILEENLAFKGGEKLVFTIHYKWGLINADVARPLLRLTLSS